ncbi:MULTISPECIES: helix-turn-helix domain-containing protein [Chryseobacterium]|uniref:Excisionase n=1 Tax=Chryseobacterium kwangjuense TaxID=267125 RepID=A0A135WJ65_9FLAO|nr:MULTISPECIES: helix-turn-helix domain-containing protein [Chryseobacterium]KXH84941.1 excisionase [Chryseobacterium kwangjuense]MCQ9634202.1 helix-turn-helix domain-containing protein [Chryseobacterium sp. WG23]
MNIDRVEFLAWMDRIMKRFDILAGDLEIRDKKRLSIDGEELLDNQDVLQMLKITYRCLQRYRTIGRIKFFTISGKIYYKSSDVQQFIRDSYHGGKYRQK